MKNIRRVLLFVSVLSLFLFIAGKTPAFTQTGVEPTGLENVHLWINPEYDDPRLLVMMEGQITGVVAPARVRFLVPSTAEMYSAGSKDAQGKYTGGPPDRKASGQPGWDEISYEVKTNVFRVEYYDTNIIGQPDKSISYEFKRVYPIANLQVIVQQPRLATNFNVTPAGQAFVDSEGFNATVYSYTALTPETPVSYKINYTKSDTRVSLNIKDTGTSSPLAAIIVVLALALVIGGILFWRRKPKARNRAARRQEKNAVAPKKPANQPKSKFCPECGKPVAGSDKFCAYCGDKLP